MYFDYRSYRCAYVHTPDHWAWLDPVNISVFLLLPTCIVVITTVWLLFYAGKVTGAHKKAVFTMLPVSIVFCLSYAPIGTYFVAEKWIIQNAEPDLHKDPLYTSLYRYGMLIKFINNSANPIIYFVTVRSFRTFVLQKVFRIKIKSADSMTTIRRNTTPRSSNSSSHLSINRAVRISRQLTKMTDLTAVPET